MTENQAALLRALSMKGARTVRQADLAKLGDKAEIGVYVPGVPKPVHVTTAGCVRASKRRHWLFGDDQRGYELSASGVLALGRA